MGMRRARKLGLRSNADRRNEVARREDNLRQQRGRLLRALEACERGLAAAYRAQARVRTTAAADALWLEQGARRHLEHAERLRAVAAASGEPIDTLWVIGPARAPATLAYAERLAYETLHDGLSGFDRAGRTLLLGEILPDHVRSLREACARAGLDVNAEGALDVP
jgi:hypothetical protein